MICCTDCAFYRSISRSEGSRSPSPEARPNKAKKNRRVQDDSDDDDELRDSEEAEDDDDYDYSRNKRKKRRKGNEFIIDEAEVDEDADEDDEAWDEDDGGFGVSWHFSNLKHRRWDKTIYFLYMFYAWKCFFLILLSFGLVLICKSNQLREFANSQLWENH